MVDQAPGLARAPSLVKLKVMQCLDGVSRSGLESVGEIQRLIITLRGHGLRGWDRVQCTPTCHCKLAVCHPSTGTSCINPGPHNKLAN